MKKLLLAIVLFWPALAAAEESRVVSHARLKLADVAPAANDVGAVDLGPAPAPGGSRIFGRAEIEEKIRAAGFDPKGVVLPKTVRVVSASLRLTPGALAKLAAPAVTSALPQGVTLEKIEPAYEIVTHPGSTVKSATVAKIPRQKGQAHSTAVLELATEDDVVTKVPVAITVDVSDAAAKAEVPRGARLDLVFERGAIRIVTAATSLVDADVGDTGNVSIVSTGRVLRARFVSRDRAEIVDKP